MDPYLPFQPGSETSREAAQSITPQNAATLREQVYRCIRDSLDGMTDDDIQQTLGLSGNTERPRRIELLEAHRIIDSGRRRRTRSGRRATVWERAA